MTREPLYLRPASYRRRRRRDAARLLPIVGAFLFLLPVLWGRGPEVPRNTAHDGVFLFLAWAGLIVLAALISRSLVWQGEARDPETDPAPDQSPILGLTEASAPDPGASLQAPPLRPRQN